MYTVTCVGWAHRDAIGNNVNLAYGSVDGLTVTALPVPSDKTLEQAAMASMDERKSYAIYLWLSRYGNLIAVVPLLIAGVLLAWTVKYVLRNTRRS